eukprot:scaffold103331_cov27-Tisochrysis_lutea.AAC.5
MSTYLSNVLNGSKSQVGQQKAKRVNLSHRDDSSPQPAGKKREEKRDCGLRCRRAVGRGVRGAQTANTNTDLTFPPKS